MKWTRSALWLILTALSLSLGPQARAHEQAAAATRSDTLAKVILIRQLPTADSAYTSLLKPPASSKLRSGFVCLQPGQPGEEHSTEAYEEMILVLDGSGELDSNGQATPVASRHMIYVPPHTTHFLRNTGQTPLRYVYTVTRVDPDPAAK
jgi:mannose-6-phosphate isomerase-like protein (cupin superfamily)